MTRCWSLEPTDRPTFKTVCQLIDGLLRSDDDAPQQVRSRESKDQSASLSDALSSRQPYRNIGEGQEEDLKRGIPQKMGEDVEEQSGNLPTTSTTGMD